MHCHRAQTHTPPLPSACNAEVVEQAGHVWKQQVIAARTHACVGAVGGTRRLVSLCACTCAGACATTCADYSTAARHTPERTPASYTRLPDSCMLFPKRPNRTLASLTPPCEHGHMYTQTCARRRMRGPHTGVRTHTRKHALAHAHMHTCARTHVLQTVTRVLPHSMSYTCRLPHLQARTVAFPHTFNGAWMNTCNMCGNSGAC